MKAVVAFLAFISAWEPEASRLRHQDVYCLAETIYMEARGEPVIGQVAVGHVVMNRVRIPAYPNSVCRVARQKMQFAPARVRAQLNERNAWQVAISIAVMVLLKKAEDPTEGATHFTTTDEVYGLPWFKGSVNRVEIGRHMFFQLSRMQ